MNAQNPKSGDVDSSGFTTVESRSPAKVNLYLDVLGPREDGYHELETIFLALPWGDDVTLRTAQTDFSSELPTRCSVTGESATQIPTDEENVALRAARTVAKRAQGNPNAFDFALEIHKRIPAGAGLGGGSSNAATVLSILAQRDRVPPASKEWTALAEIGRSLGADVPFFMRQDFSMAPFASIGLDRGDRLVGDLDIGKGLAVVLMLTGIHCSTAEVFGAFQRGPRDAPVGGMDAVRDALANGDAPALRRAHFNALAFSAMKRYSRLRVLATAIERKLGYPPALSGTGSTLYDIVTIDEAERVESCLEGLPIRLVTVPLA